MYIFFYQQDDQNYLIKHVHLEHMIKPEWKNPARGAQTKDVMKAYLTQLSSNQILSLYEMFKLVILIYFSIEYYNKNVNYHLIIIFFVDLDMTLSYLTTRQMNIWKLERKIQTPLSVKMDDEI